MVAKEHKDELDKIKENVKESTLYFDANARRYHKLRSFLFRSNLTEDDKSKLEEIDKPAIEFNVLESYVSRLRGEFSKQEPSIHVSGAPGANAAPQLLESLEGHFRYILDDANKRSFEFDTYTDGLSGGYSVFKLWLEYENNKSFNQVLKLGRGSDPTLFGFDPLAREPHKADAEYSYEKFPKSYEDIKREYPDADLDALNYNASDGEFSWAYKTGERKIILLTDYYEKKKNRKKIIHLSNGAVSTPDEYEIFLAEWAKIGTLELPPVVINDRWIEEQTVCNYIFIGNEVLEYNETIFKYLPHIFYSGNAIFLRENEGSGEIKQFTRPYFYHAVGMQKLKNLSGQTIASEIENFSPSKYMADKRSIPTQYLEDWLNPQKAKTLIYDSYTKDGIPIPPPTNIVHPPIPQEIAATFMTAEQNIQSILGAYDAALGINKNQLSGVAIVEGATQSNAAAMPYVVNYLTSLSQAAEFMLDVIPKINKTPRTLPIIDKEGKAGYVVINTPPKPGQPPSPQYNYDPDDLNVSVKAGVNYEIQKNANIQLLGTLGQAFPVIGQFINDVGMPFIFDNIDIYGGAELKDEAVKWTKAKQMNAQQMAQNNPAMIDLNLRKQELAQAKEMADMQYQIKQQQMAIEQEKLKTDKFEAMIKFYESHQDNLVQLTKAANTKTKDIAQIAMAKVDQDHQHAKDIVGVLQEIANSSQKQKASKQAD